MDDSVTICPICMNTLQIPRCISCSHTFCQNCLQDHIETSCQGKDFPAGFRCPVCCTFVPGSISDDPSHWAETFPKNATIDFMIQNNDKNVLKFCKPCLNDNKEEPAATLCRSCMECLCEGCTSYHKKLTITKDHDVVHLDEINTSVYRENEDHCNKHDFRYFDLFCFDHDTPCCSVCSVTDHKTCKMDTIEKAFEKIEKKNESQQMLSEVDRAESHLKKLKDIQKEKQTKIEDEANEIRNDTKTFRQKINETLERLEHNLLEDLAQNMKSTQKAIDGNNETLSDLIDLSNNCKEFLISPSKRSCNPGYVGGFHKVKKQMKRLKSAKLYIKDAEISATFPDVLMGMKYSKQPQVVNPFSFRPGGTNLQLSATLTAKENPISLINLDFQSVQKGIVQEEQYVLDILKDGAVINDLLFFENGTDILAFVDDKTGVVWDAFNICSKSVLEFRFTILRAVIIKTKLYVVSDKGNLYALEIFQNNTTYTKIDIKRRCSAVSVFQESLVVGCANAILHTNTNGNEAKNFPIEGCVVDIISLTSGNNIYIDQLSMNRERTVRAIDNNGRGLWQYEHTELKCASGLTKDNLENIYISGCSSHNIHLISSAGYALKIFEEIASPGKMIIRKESDDEIEFYVVSAWKSIKQVNFIW